MNILFFYYIYLSMIIWFIIGVLLCIVGLTFWIIYINVGNILDYFICVFKCIECYFLPLGIYILWKIKR